MFGSYQGWLDGIKVWLDVDESTTVAQIPTFLKLAEHEMNRRCRLKEQIACAYTDIDSDGVLTLPGDYAQMLAVHLTATGRPVEAVSANEYYRRLEENYGSGNEPDSYAVIGERLQFVPTGAGMRVKIDYWREVPHVDADTYPTIFTEYAPEALLAGACAFGSRYIVEDQREVMFRKQFDDAIDRANQDAQDDRFGSSPLRIQFGATGRGRRHGRYFRTV